MCISYCRQDVTKGSYCPSDGCYRCVGLRIHPHLYTRRIYQQKILQYSSTQNKTRSLSVRHCLRDSPRSSKGPTQSVTHLIGFRDLTDSIFAHTDCPQALWFIPLSAHAETVPLNCVMTASFHIYSNSLHTFVKSFEAIRSELLIASLNKLETFLILLLIFLFWSFQCVYEIRGKTKFPSTLTNIFFYFSLLVTTCFDLDKTILR